MDLGKNRRLVSLDVLRGLDMFVLVILAYWLRSLDVFIDQPWTNAIVAQLKHREWDGLNLLDMLMPLFLFCTGTAIPFAFTKYREQGRSKARVYLRIFRRFVLLWLLGMVHQGNLLSLDPERIRFYNNTLQAIGIGYVVASILYLNTGKKTQSVIFLVLLAGYWALLSFARVGGHPAGDFSMDGNVCSLLADRIRVMTGLPRVGKWSVCWVGFIATVLSGSLVGQYLMSDRSDVGKACGLVLYGSGMLAAGYLLSLQMPIIKEMWNTTFILVSSGYSTVLLGILFYCIDCKGWKKPFVWLLPVGMNAILAYLIPGLVDFRIFARPLFFGLEQFMSAPAYTFLIRTCDALFLYLLLLHLYRRKIFVRL